MSVEFNVEEAMSLTYSEYLKVDELLSLQQPRSDGPEHDEMLFIVIHQVYELWFKQILHEVDHLQMLLEDNKTPPALHTFKLTLTILKVLVAQLDILETMTPLDFLSFRERLESGSGFQSYQFRALEFALGHKDRAAVQRFADGTAARNDLEGRFNRPTLWDSFLRYLKMKGCKVPEQLLRRDVTLPVEPSTELQKMLIDVYREDLMTASVCERLIDLDEGIQEWRYRHVKMVERTIGNKPGTGGSTGVEYLKATLFKPLFPDLWQIRTEF
jgi:tryptophan 2,3-dioxygenase